MSDYQLQQLCYLILLFFVFSVLGWCMEVFLKYRQYHRFINRGFMIGPYCPIYGSGIVFITVMVNVLSGVETSVGTTFMISFLGCGALEYAVSYYMEKRYHARWWDYSTKPMNLNGRIWIGNLILFGIGGTLVIEVINPIVYSLFYRIPERVLYVLSVLVVLVMLSDNITSQFVMKFVKSSVENSEADNTESISKEIRMLMKDKSILYRRFADAYPDVIYRTDRIKRKMQEVKTEMERIQQEAAGNLERISEGTKAGMERISEGTKAGMERISEGTKAGVGRISEGTKAGVDHLLQETRSGLERFQQGAEYGIELMKVPSSELRDEIIAAQDQLIVLLGEEQADPEQITELRTEIMEKKKKLMDRQRRLPGTRNPDPETPKQA